MPYNFISLLTLIIIALFIYLFLRILKTTGHKNYTDLDHFTHQLGWLSLISVTALLFDQVYRIQKAGISGDLPDGDLAGWIIVGGHGLYIGFVVVTRLAPILNAMALSAPLSTWRSIICFSFIGIMSFPIVFSGLFSAFNYKFSAEQQLASILSFYLFTFDNITVGLLDRIFFEQSIYQTAKNVLPWRWNVYFVLVAGGLLGFNLISIITKKLRTPTSK